MTGTGHYATWHCCVFMPMQSKPFMSSSQHHPCARARVYRLLFYSCAVEVLKDKASCSGYNGKCHSKTLISKMAQNVSSHNLKVGISHYSNTAGAYLQGVMRTWTLLPRVLDVCKCQPLRASPRWSLFIKVVQTGVVKSCIRRCRSLSVFTGCTKRQHFSLREGEEGRWLSSGRSCRWRTVVLMVARGW